MEASVNKSPTRSSNKSTEIIVEVNPRVMTVTADQERESLSNSSTVAVDSGRINNQTNENSVSTLQIKIDNEAENLSNKKIDHDLTISIAEVQNQSSDFQNEHEIFKDLKDSNIVSDISEKKMTKPLRSRMSCRKSTIKVNAHKGNIGKTVPLKNTTRKVLAEKQIRSVPAPGRAKILLRSSKKKGTNLIGDNTMEVNSQISDEKKITVTSKNSEDISNGSESMVKENFSPVKDDVLVEPEQSPGNDEEHAVETKKRKTIPFESLSLMEKILISQDEMLANMCNRDGSTHQTNENEVRNDKENTLPKECSKNETASRKRFHRRKCSEPLKNERVQTRRSRSIMLMQNKNECKYFPQGMKTVKCITSETDDGSEDKMQTNETAVTCTPDSNTNDSAGETVPGGNQNPEIHSSGKKNKNKSGDDNDQLGLNSAEKNPADEISPCYQNDLGCSVSSNSTISLKKKSGSQATAKYCQPTEKPEQENVNGNLKRKLRHVNAQSMPVYMGRIALSKNENRSKSPVDESLPSMQNKNEDDKSKSVQYNEAEKEGENPVAIEKNHCNDIFLRSKTDKTTNPKHSYLSNTDSEDTLSNVESVPNSPAQETWPNVASKKFKLSMRRAKTISGRSCSEKNHTSLTIHETSAEDSHSITGKNDNTKLELVAKEDYSETAMSSNPVCTSKKNESKPQYYVETLAIKNPRDIPDEDEENANNAIDAKDFSGQQKMPWLRHYERPQKTHVDTVNNASALRDNGKENSAQENRISYHQANNDVRTTKRKSNISVANNLVTENINSTKGYSFRNRPGRVLQPVINPPVSKRGRPKKSGVKNSRTNSEESKKRKSSTNKSTRNDSGLTKLELERLFFKFLQDGHFRIAPGEQPIIICSNDVYQNYSTRMQCHGPRRCSTHPQNMETRNNCNETYPHPQHYPQTDNGHRFNPPNNNNSAEVANKTKTMNPNLYNFSNEHVEQTTYSTNSSPCNTNANIHLYNTENVMTNAGSYNGISQTNSVPNYMQSEYGTLPNHLHNFDNNNANVMGNDIYSNSYPGFVNSNRFDKNTTTGTMTASLSSTTDDLNDDFNFILNQHQHRNPIPCTGPMSDGNTVSSNSMNLMQNSPSNNLNFDWNLGCMDQLHSVNGLSMDFNSMSNDENGPSSAIAGNCDSKDVNNQNSLINGSSPWINGSNKTMNPQFPVLPPWHGSLPMYNSYLNNGNPYYNNMLNPYATCMGFDLANYSYANMNSKNVMGNNNGNPWMQGTSPDSDIQTPFNTMNTDFCSMSSVSPQGRTANQKVNSSLSAGSLLSQSNPIGLDDAASGMGHSNGLNPNIERSKMNTFAEIEKDDNNVPQKSARGYADEITLPYSLEYKTHTQDLDFDNIKITDINENDINNRQQQNLPRIQDYMTRRLDGLEQSGNESCEKTGPPSCGIVAEQSTDRESEMSKLRQELADFTRQYSDEQISSTLQIPQGEEIFI